MSSSLLVVSHVLHKSYDKRIFAYGPYAREIEQWCDLFDQVVIAAPGVDEQPGPSDEWIRRNNLSLAHQPDIGTTHGVRRVLRTLRASLSLAVAMTRCTAIHVRCPGNLGLLGVLLGPMFSRRLVAKYAGSWPDYANEPSSYRLQKRILRSLWWRGPVTVYGQWGGNRPKVTPFFTAAMDRNQLEGARAAALERASVETLRLLYVGRLSSAKNVDVLIAAVHDLSREGLSVSCQIVGEGPERDDLENQVGRLGLGDAVVFRGSVGLDEMPSIYSSADVLVLVSQSEGWPKAIAEAMAFGLVCIGSDQGFVPNMLADGRGVSAPPRDKEALVRSLRHLAAHPKERVAMGKNASDWASSFALEDLREAIKDLLESSWNVRLPLR